MESSSGKVGPALQTSIIEKLKKITSGQQADSFFSPNIRKLDEAFKTSDTKSIKLHIDYFEKILSKTRFVASDEKAVEDVKQEIQKVKREVVISTLVTSEMEIISEGKTKYVFLQEHLNMLKEDISRKDFDMQRFKTASNGLEDETSANLLQIRQECDAIFRKHEALEMQISNLAQCIREDNLSKENVKRTFHVDMQIIMDALCNVSTNDKASHEEKTKRMVDEITKLKREVVLIRAKDCDLIRSHANENQRMVDDITQLKGEVIAIRKEKDDLLLRIHANDIGSDSYETSGRFSGNKPYQRDSTKLAAKYKDLYKTEWCKAYEVIKDLRSSEREQEICSYLVQILVDAEGHCTRISNLQKRRMLVMLFRPNGVEDKATESECNSTQWEKMHDLRNQVAEKSLESVFRGFKPSMDVPDSKKVQTFVYKCIEICWYMCLQKPPVVLDKYDKKGSTFNEDEYDVYKKKGTNIAFVTWPPLLLHEGGPLLCKGVAKGRD